jgi:hypothetical protein
MIEQKKSEISQSLTFKLKCFFFYNPAGGFSLLLPSSDFLFISSLSLLLLAPGCRP